jgi:hypothetical protein
MPPRKRRGARGVRGALRLRVAEPAIRRGVSEAAQALGTSLPRYYQLEQRALAGLVSACEPAPRGPRQDLARQVAKLEREKQRLERECDRRQALVRVAQRSLGLAPPAPTKPAGKDEPAAGDGAKAKRRRNRRPMVRALKAARALEREGAVTEGESAADPPLAVAAGS